MKPSEIIMVVVGFFLLAIMAPIGLSYLYSINSTFNATGTASTYSAVFTIWSVLLPVMFLIGVAFYFIPKMKGNE